MNDATQEELEEEIVRALLAPLARAEPVVLGSARAARRWRRPVVIGAGIAASLALVGGGMAAAGAFGPLHGAVLRLGAPDVPLNGTTACQLVGETATQADKILTANGYQVEWRFMTWGSQLVPAQVSTTLGRSASSTPGTTAPAAPAPAGAVVGGYESAPRTVPGDSIVWQLLSDSASAKTVLVFVEAPDDPDAPTVEAPSCSTTPSS
jgi:hypothetical protein